MKKILPVMMICFLSILLPNAINAEKGGTTPCLVGCCLGPRIGLEYNEGKEIETSEWLELVFIGFPINWFNAYSKNGFSGCLLEMFLGPRVGREYNKWNPRTMEWLGLIPVVTPITNILMCVEAYEGKTMTEISQREHLSK